MFCNWPVVGSFLLITGDDVWAGGRVVITICLCLTVVVEHLSPSNLVVADYWA